MFVLLRERVCGPAANSVPSQAGGIFEPAGRIETACYTSGRGIREVIDQIVPRTPAILRDELSRWK